MNLNGNEVKKDFSKDILKSNKMIEETNKIISNLYEDKISGQISQDTFSMLMQKYENQKKMYEDEIKRYKEEELGDSEISNINKEEFETTMKEMLEFKEINQENKSLIFKLIDKIIIDDKDVMIKYKFDISA